MSQAEKMAAAAVVKSIDKAAARNKSDPLGEVTRKLSDDMEKISKRMEELRSKGDSSNKRDYYIMRDLDNLRNATGAALSQAKEMQAREAAEKAQGMDRMYPSREEVVSAIASAIPSSLRSVGQAPPMNGFVLTAINGKGVWKPPPPAPPGTIPFGGAVWWYGDPENPPEGWEVVGHPDNNSPRVGGRTIRAWAGEDPDFGEVGETGGADTAGINHLHDNDTPPEGVGVRGSLPDDHQAPPATFDAVWAPSYGDDASDLPETYPSRNGLLTMTNKYMTWVMIWRRPPDWDGASWSGGP